MTDIEVSEDMNVTLVNVLARRLESDSQENMHKSARMFETFLKREGLESFGPIIMKTTSAIVDNTTLIENEMMIQLREAPKNVEDPYSFHETLRLEGYLMARYFGPLDMVEMATLKLKLYAFEKGINLGSAIYSVYVRGENETYVDVYQQVL